MIYDKFKARKISNEVEAIQLRMVSSRSYRKCAEFAGKLWKGITEDSELPSVLSPLGYVKVNNYDYIIKDPKGVFYVCPQHVFEQAYEILDDVDESKPNQAGTVSGYDKPFCYYTCYKEDELKASGISSQTVPLTNQNAQQ